MASPQAHSRTAVCSWSLRPAGARELIEALRRVGIGAVQLALLPLLRDPKWAGAIAQLREAGIEIVSGMLAMRGEDYSTLDTIARTGGVRLDENWPANRQSAAEAARLAGDEGVLLVTFHAGFLPEDQSDPQRRTMLDRLGEIAGLFEDRGVSLGFETGQETAPTLLDVLQELRRPNVGVNFDPANMILYGKGDPIAALKLLAPHVVQIHVKDALPTLAPGTWGREVPAGRGSVDWPAFFRVAAGLPRPVSFVIEREAGQDRTDDIIAARELIEQHAGAEAGR